MSGLVAITMAGRQRCLDAWRKAVVCGTSPWLTRSLAGINIESSGGSVPCSIVAGTPSKRLGVDTTALSCRAPGLSTPHINHVHQQQ